MVNQVAGKLNFSRKLLLVVAGSMAVAGPVVIVALNASVSQAQAVAPAPASEGHARGDLSGDWQGTLQAGKSLRTVLKITKTDKGWSATMYSIDQGAQPIKATSATLDGSTFKYSVDLIGGSYQGTLSADGNSIAGSWTQGPNPLPLTLVRATKETRSEEQTSELQSHL